MSLLSSLQLMSQYNQWMNQKFYQVAQQLGNEKIQQDQGAFFGSILGILNHIYVADIIWLRRFFQHSQPYQSLNQLPELSSYTALDQIVTQDLAILAILRQELDIVIVNWCQELKSEDLKDNLQYFDSKGNVYHKNFGQLIYHFFNHQTHHRGQASSLISQQGLDIGITDLLKIIPES
jgi:uncharacterized damage-inducible protein DinB